MVNLGDEVKDLITGFQGIVTAKTDYIYGCTRVQVQPPVGKDGKIPETGTFDAPGLKVIKAAKIKRASNDTGGPKDTLKQASIKR